MNLHLPPLVLTVRALRTESRSLSPYLTRLALGVVMLLALVMAHFKAQFVAAPGRQFISSVLFINYFFISLAGVAIFASAISEEKEQQTIGLLRMTGLSPISILLGKTAARLTNGLLLLIIQIPFAMLAITLGGVGLPQIVSGYAILVSYMLLICGLAVFCSTICRRTGSAGGLTLIVLIAMQTMPAWFPGVQYLVEQRLGVGGGVTEAMAWLNDWLMATSPMVALQRVMTNGYTAWWLPAPTIGNAVGGLMWFLLAWAAFNRFNRALKDVEPTRLRLPRGSGRIGRILNTRAWAASPTAWMQWQFGTGGVAGLILKLLGGAALIGLVLAIMSASEGRIDRELLALVVIWIAIIALFVEISLFAGRVFRDEVRWKTLSALATLPTPLPITMYSKIAGWLPSLLPTLFWLAVGMALVPEESVEGLGDLVVEPGFWLMMTYVLLLFHAIALLSVLTGWPPLVTALVCFAGWVIGSWIAAMFVGIVSFLLFSGGTNIDEDVLYYALSALGIGLLLLLCAGCHLLIWVRLRVLVGRS